MNRSTISKTKCAYFAEAAAVCLSKFKHGQGVKLEISGDVGSKVKISWERLDSSIFGSWSNLEETVEDAAYGIAIGVIWLSTEYQVIRQSEKGIGTDFWCSKKEGKYPFQYLAKLEVSGILKGSIGQVNYRVKKKLERAKKNQKDNLPLIVIVCEFSRPMAKIKLEK